MANGEEAPAVPKPTLFDQIGALITRLDPLVAYIAELERRRERVDKEILETLKSVAAALGVLPLPEVVKPELIPVMRVVTVPTEPIDVRVAPTPLQVTFRPRNKNYISEENTVAKDKPRELNVRVDLGRDGEYGYVVSDRATIGVRINGGELIKLFKGQVIYFHELNLLVSKLDLKTDSATPVPYRLLVA